MATPRKLLILDLNGTLLVRGSHAKRKAPVQSHIYPGGPSVQHSRLRAVHGRPYLPSFREYLFHAETKKWLDTMVWSSAQPHSVADMVHHCFAETKEELLAIWARDTLGLSQKAYNQKTQTTKDLAKPWGAFPMHSAKTTLLLDDSILKAQLQPWNHLCIPEYVTEMRVKDLETLKHFAQGAAHLIETGIVSDEVRTPILTSSTTAKARLSTHNGAKLATSPPEGTVTHKYDEALLAVIGILDVLKDKPNVGRWIRAGGLNVKVPSPVEPIIRNSMEHNNTRSHESGNTMSLADLDDAISSIDDNMITQATASLWFERDDLVSVWASKGRRVLDELRIDVVSGIKA